MITEERRRQVFAIAIPIIFGMLSQNVLNLVDAAMVGSLGNAALASVGLASFANFVAGAPLMGLAAGVQAMAARRVGENRADEAAIPLNGGLLVCVAFGIPWIGSIALASPWWFPRLAGDPEIARVGLPYLLCRLAGSLMVGIHFSFRAFWNATGRSTFYMFTLLFMHVLNIGLSYMLIYGNFGAPKLGVTGAGISSALAALIGVGMHTTLASRVARSQGFLSGIPTRETLKSMLRISVPSSLQQVFFAAGMTAMMALLARAGTATAAASKVLLDLALVGMLPALGFGLAGTTLVSQALGRDDVQDAQRWGWDVAQVALATVALIALPALLFPESVLGFFLRDPATIELARAPFRLVACTVGLDAVGMVLQSCLLGAGDSKRVMAVSLSLQWGVLLPMMAVFVLVLHLGMLPVWILQASYRFVQASTFIAMWRRGGWQGIKV
jgi:putative MATE family efflux protein